MMWRPTNPVSKLIARTLILAHRSNVIVLPTEVAAICVEALVTRALTPGSRISLGAHWLVYGPKIPDSARQDLPQELAIAV